MARKTMPLPVRFNAALSEAAYAQLRALNARTGLSNNYLLTILLERLDAIADPDRLQTEFDAFISEYGAPASGVRMSKGSGGPNG
ncbi:MAG TPA: hypothetical protein PK812_01275 [Beijerinckiaceae bacterium]|nr:hypothetical protein [Beijerinckiaceae bacterium]